MKRPLLLSLTFLCAAAVSSFGAASSGSSSAGDIAASATLSGTLAGSSIGTLNIDVTPINSAQGTAPLAYSTSPSLLTTKSSGSGLATLGLAANVLQVNALSNIDGGEGARFASATSAVTNASANLGLNLGALGTVNILTIGVSAIDPLEGITSDSSVSWNGSSLAPASESNLLSNGTLSLKILGINIVIPSLTAGIQTVVPINVSLGLLNVTGTIGLTADDFDTSLALPSGFASASSLSVDANLSLTAIGGTSINLGSDININQTTAQLTAVAVPEPSSITAFSLGLGLVLLRRRR